MRMLVAIDGSAHSIEAVKYLIAHASDYCETPAVDLVYVNLPLPRLPSMALSVDQIRRYYEDEGNASLAGAKNLLDRAGIAYTAHILAGPVAETIVDLGRKTACDIILLSTRGTGLAGNLLLGSTATKVLYFANIPVLVVKSPISL